MKVMNRLAEKVTSWSNVVTQLDAAGLFVFLGVELRYRGTGARIMNEKPVRLHATGFNLVGIWTCKRRRARAASRIVNVMASSLLCANARPLIHGLFHV